MTVDLSFAESKPKIKKLNSKASTKPVTIVMSDGFMIKLGVYFGCGLFLFSLGVSIVIGLIAFVILPIISVIV